MCFLVLHTVWIGASAEGEVLEVWGSAPELRAWALQWAVEESCRRNRCYFKVLGISRLCSLLQSAFPLVQLSISHWLWLNCNSISGNQAVVLLFPICRAVIYFSISYCVWKSFLAHSEEEMQSSAVQLIQLQWSHPEPISDKLCASVRPRWALRLSLQHCLNSQPAKSDFLFLPRPEAFHGIFVLSIYLKNVCAKLPISPNSLRMRNK